jgi:hypothetical protein
MTLVGVNVSEIDTHRSPAYRKAIYDYSTAIAHEEPVREKFTRTGSSFVVLGAGPGVPQLDYVTYALPLVCWDSPTPDPMPLDRREVPAARAGNRPEWPVTATATVTQTADTEMPRGPRGAGPWPNGASLERFGW